jgi:hypothetical protein
MTLAAERSVRAPRRRAHSLSIKGAVMVSCSLVGEALFGAAPKLPSVLRYSLEAYPFASAAQRIFGRRLDQLADHTVSGLLQPGRDQATELHQRFYGSLGQFLPLYQRFVRAVIAPLFAEPFCYQKVPTFRVHLQSNVAVGEFHVDSDYNHPKGEINFWVPLTACWDTNSIWVETEPGRGDFEAASLSPGELLVFDATSLRHGNRVNTTRHTRVSFDFRCLPLSRYRHSAKRSVSQQVALRIGEYYELHRPGLTACGSYDAPDI